MSNPDVATSLGSELSSSVPPDVEVLSAADSSPPGPEVVVTDVEVLSAADSSPPSPEVVVSLSAGSGVERSEPPPQAEASSSVRRTAENCLIG